MHTQILNAEGKYPTQWAADVDVRGRHAARLVSDTSVGVQTLRLRSADSRKIIAVAETEKGSPWGQDEVAAWVEDAI